MIDKTNCYCPKCNAVWTSDIPYAEYTEVWNAAIEAAAKVSEINSAANIRKLKK